ncbi:hypothetical protein LEP1GSC166_3909 [Leptospira kirschneri]|nr:hypothetical protein LEP1GSC166_3909 [Leptospira kirschneri]
MNFANVILPSDVYVLSESALLSDWTGFKIPNQDSIPDPCLSLQENKIEIIKILKSIFIFELIFNNLKSLIQSLYFNFKKFDQESISM